MATRDPADQEIRKEQRGSSNQLPAGAGSALSSTHTPGAGKRHGERDVCMLLPWRPDLHSAHASCVLDTDSHILRVCVCLRVSRITEEAEFEYYYGM